MLRTFDLVVSVEAHICDDSPGFPPQAHATQWLFDVFTTAFSEKILRKLECMATHKTDKERKKCSFCKVMQQEADAILKLRKTIKLKEV